MNGVLQLNVGATVKFALLMSMSGAAGAHEFEGDLAKTEDNSFEPMSSV